MGVSVASLTLSLLAAGNATPAAAIPPPDGGHAGLGTAAPAAQLNLAITKLLRHRLANPALGHDTAIQVRSPDGQQVLFSSRARAAQLPASNMKLVTALGALTSLGPTARFGTQVTARAKGSGVILVGGGDPLLSRTGLDSLAARTATALKASRDGGTPKTLKVFIDDSLFNDTSLPAGWPRSYVPSEVTHVRALGRLGVRVTDSGLEAARVFVERLRARGIQATAKGRGGGAHGPRLARLGGHTVGQAVSVMLRVSDNQVAEILFRQTALATGHPPTWAGAAAAARQTLVENGISTKGLVLKDGSGLSRSDRLTTRALAQLLTLVRSGRDPRLQGVEGWLPVAGRSGTLGPYTSRYVTRPSSCAAGRVHAKTGTLTGALALSGVAVGVDGRRRVFSIIVNHPPYSRFSPLTIRRAMDGLAATVTGCW